MAAPETRIDVSCSVPLKITDVSATMQPWMANCGPHAFEFAAVLTAPAHNVDGEAQYVWRFGRGAPQLEKVVFAPVQTTQTIVVSQTYNILWGALMSPGTGMAADAERTAVAPAAPKATPTPSPTPEPKPTQPPSSWPSAISKNAWATIYC